MVFGMPYPFKSFLSGFRTWAEKCLGHASQTHAGLTFRTNYLLSSLHTIHPCRPHTLNVQKKKEKKIYLGLKRKVPNTSKLELSMKERPAREPIAPPEFYKGAGPSCGNEFK